MESQHSSAVLCIGERLADARRNAGLSVADIAARTKVSSRYIEAIETEAFECLPSRVHTVGFARAMAKAVALDDQEISASLRSRLDAQQVEPPQSKTTPSWHKSVLERITETFSR